MIYKQGSYTVDVGADGTIIVKPGDWLSKYSAAMYNNLTTINVFARRDKSGQPVPIQNVNLIYAGETLYHLPTYYKSLKKPITETPKPAVPSLLAADERRKMIAEALQKNRVPQGERLDTLVKIIDGLGYIENAIGLAEIAGLMAEASVVAAAGTVLSYLGAFLSPIAASITAVNAYEFGQRITGFRAIAYGITAWAFDDPQPSFPARIRANLIASGGDSGRREATKRERVWNEARDAAVKNLDQTVAEKRLQKKSYQVVFRAEGDDNRKTLATKLMKNLEPKLDATPTQRAMMWLPAPDYPNV